MNRNKNILARIDWITILLYLTLVIIGWINIYAAVYNTKHQSILDFSQKYGKQLIWIFAGIILIIIIFIIKARFYKFFAYPIYVITIILLIFVLLFGREVNGARSWFEIGNFRLQPAEFAKFATSLALAKFLSSFNLNIKKLKNIFLIAAIIFIPVILILLQNDTGSALVYFIFVLVLFREGLSANILIFGFLAIVLFVLALILKILTVLILIVSIAFFAYWITQRKLKTIIIALSIFVIISLIIWTIKYYTAFNINDSYIILISFIISSVYYVFYAFKNNQQKIYSFVFITLASLFFVFSVNYAFNNILEQHQRDRINNLLGIKYDPLGTGYNVNQSKIAIGSGGFSGKGFLQGTQTKFNFVPEQSTDFIFCTIGEEWGFIGTSLVLILFVALVLRLIFLAERQRTPFSRIYGYSVAAILFFHFAVNIGMTIGLAPVIGIPLPFISYGGSSLWSFTILLFIFIKLDSNRTELI